MPSRKPPPDPSWLVILEDMRSHSRATIEAVEASRLASDERSDRLEREMGSRIAVVEAAIQSSRVTLEHRIERVEQTIERADQENRSRFAGLEAAIERLDSRDASLEVAIRDLKVSVQQNSVDIRELAGKVEALSRLETRVTALEQRGV